MATSAMETEGPRTRLCGTCRAKGRALGVTMFIDQRLRRSERLTRRSDYQRVYARHCQVSDQWFRVYGVPNDLNRSRVGLSVSRRVGNAVQRHRVRRGIRETFRRNKDKLTRSWDVIVVARPSAADPHCDVASSLPSLLQRLNAKYASPTT
jgi:ribonuclease P protein component